MSLRSFEAAALLLSCKSAPFALWNGLKASVESAHLPLLALDAALNPAYG
jgi:hypothetical protein